MIQLNLPSYEYILSRKGGKVAIFDSIRKKYVNLTPEEWVRQHMINYLVVHRHYPRALIRIEGGLLYNQMARRTDIVVHDRTGNPWMIVECKSPDVMLDDTTTAQVAMYNASLKATYLVITNGLIHFSFRTDWNRGVTEKLPDLPEFPDLGEV